jgi:hypothetical protein
MGILVLVAVLVLRMRRNKRRMEKPEEILLGLFSFFWKFK